MDNMENKPQDTGKLEPVENGDNRRKKGKDPEDGGSYMSLGMCVGMCMGMALGQLIFDSMTIGLVVGMCAGMCIGLCVKKK